MEQRITILSDTQPQSIYLAKAKLESEGIESFIKDEFTTQVHNFYANAIGGVKLQVYENDVHSATMILTLGEIVKPVQSNPNDFFQKLNQATKKLPFIGGYIFEKRLLILIILLLIIIFIPILILGL